jgi:hypothetical protein
MIQDQKDGQGKHREKREELPAGETDPNVDAQAAPDEPKGNDDRYADKETLTPTFHEPNILVSEKSKRPRKPLSGLSRPDFQAGSATGT